MENKREKPVYLELLAPARDLKTGYAAVRAGADAVYIGGPQFGARGAAGNSWEDIEEMVKFAHQFYVRVYVPLNTIFFDSETAAVKEAINKAYRIGVDAIIIQDMGIMEMDLPPIPVFASTQTHNYDVEQVRFLEQAGFSRVILARECGLEKIKKIRSEAKVDLETFVHGALCVSFSGRCYMSQAICGRSANRGQCIQACRLPYSLIDAKGKVLAKDKFLLSLKDLNLSGSLGNLVEAGITSFKIEGRLKNEIYVANVVAKYRQELDKIITNSNGAYKKQSSGEITLEFEPDLERTFNRGYTDYFLRGKQKDIVSLDSQKSLGKLIGKVKKVGGDFFVIDRGNDLANGDGLCWFDSDQVLTGVNINSVVVDKISGEQRIYPAKWVPLKTGADIYRNLDPAFEKKVLGGAARRVGVDFAFKENEGGFGAIATDEDGNAVEAELKLEKNPAQKPELAQKSWEQQFSKLGGTIFQLRNFSFDFKEFYFVPLSALNDWRRETVEKLLAERMKNYPRVLIEHKKTDHPYHRNEINYSYNVANNLARKFYERHGVKILESSFEQQKNTAGKKVMTAKYCVRHSMGLCKKECAKSGIEIEEPLYLVCGEKKFRLNFNCSDCVMEIFNQEF